MTAEGRSAPVAEMRVPASRDLEACLIHVGQRLERPVTAAAIDAQRSGIDGVFGPRDVLDLAARCGVQAAFGARAIKDLDASLLPAILLLEEDRAVVLEGRDASGRLVVFDPRLGEICHLPGLTQLNPQAIVLSNFVTCGVWTTN